MYRDGQGVPKDYGQAIFWFREAADQGFAAAQVAAALGTSKTEAGRTPLLSWSAPRRKRVLYVDGEMPLVSLQERLRSISTGLGAEVPNERFQLSREPYRTRYFAW